MDTITWIVVGTIAGLLASATMRGSGFGLLGDLLLGIAGAFVGTWIFHEFSWRLPLDGIPGLIVVAFVGAVVVLLALRLFSVAVTRTKRPIQSSRP